MKPPIDQIIQGNNVEVMAGWEDECIDMFLTSPPYDNLRTYDGFEWDFEGLADQLWRVMKPGAVAVWVVGDATVDGSETGTSFRQALYFMEIGFRLHDTMIYQKVGNGAPQSKPYSRYSHCFEYMFVLSKGFPQTFNPLLIHGKEQGFRYKSKRQKNGKIVGGIYNSGAGSPAPNVWKIAHDHMTKGGKTMSSNHPAPFPEKLARDHIISWSNPGDLVLDPFMGSGTTAKMAHLTDRHFIGIDISPDYVALAQRRVAAVKAQPKLFAWDLEPANRQPEVELV